ncbi:hypothetical protein [Dokdonia sp.]|uniref:hypothetical protein n=1 Tax=Dokdonia sp. TaxID=2024995 RepID=UPI003265F47D
MTKKIMYTIVFLITTSQIGFSQGTLRSEKYHFSFETSANIAQYDTESDRVVGYENDDLAVDIEIFYPNEVAKDYFVNLSKTTESIARQLSLHEVKTAIKLPHMEHGYYVRSSDLDEDPKTPVFVVVMYNEKEKIIYEATIYCYNQDVVAGEKIAQSFRLIN